MKLWLLCFVLIFAAVEGLQSLGGWPDLGSSPLWHPLTVLAGIGLAVLSNAEALGLGANRTPDQLKSVTLPPDTAALPSPPTPPSADAQAQDLSATQAKPQTKTTTKASPGIDSPSVKPKTKGRRRVNAKADSISFEIHRSS
ncbi:MAG: hypothetical protein ACHWZW_05765 [Spirulina sp.]